jgi:hypothetical protein
VADSTDSRETLSIEFSAIGDLDDLTQVYDGDAVAAMSDGGQVVADKQITHPQVLLEMLQRPRHNDFRWVG